MNCGIGCSSCRGRCSASLSGLGFDWGSLWNMAQTAAQTAYQAAGSGVLGGKAKRLAGKVSRYLPGDPSTPGILPAQTRTTAAAAPSSGVPVGVVAGIAAALGLVLVLRR